MAQQTQVNGTRYSFTNVSVQMGGADVPKGVFKSINYEATQEPGIVQGNQVGIMGRTDGYGQATGSFEMLMSEANDFFAELTEDGAVPIMSVFFDIAVSYSVNDVDVITDTLQGCKISKITQSNAQGTDATMVSCDLSVARLYRNGIAAFGDPAF